MYGIWSRYERNQLTFCQSQNRLTSLEAKLDGVLTSAAHMDHDRKNEERLAEANASLDTIRADNAKLSREVEKMKKDLIGAASSASEAKAKLEQARDESCRLATDIRNIRDEHSALSTRYDGLSTLHEHMIAERNVLQGQFDGVTEAMKALQREQDTTFSQLAEMTKKYQLLADQLRDAEADRSKVQDAMEDLRATASSATLKQQQELASMGRVAKRCGAEFADELEASRKQQVESSKRYEEELTEQKREMEKLKCQLEKNRAQAEIKEAVWRSKSNGLRPSSPISASQHAHRAGSMRIARDLGLASPANDVRLLDSSQSPTAHQPLHSLRIFGPPQSQGTIEMPDSLLYDDDEPLSDALPSDDLRALEDSQTHFTHASSVNKSHVVANSASKLWSPHRATSSEQRSRVGRKRSCSVVTGQEDEFQVPDSQVGCPDSSVTAEASKRGLKRPRPGSAFQTARSYHESELAKNSRGNSPRSSLHIHITSAAGFHCGPATSSTPAGSKRQTRNSNKCNYTSH